MLAYWFGINPFKFDKETCSISFRWISSETFWSLVRLVVINAPFSYLPVILWGVYGPAEWEKEGGFANATSQSISKAPTVWLIVFAVEYISSYAYFVLQRAAKMTYLTQMFLAVQGSSIGDLVTHSLTNRLTD